ncbi:MAG: hypothetical protein V3U15_00545 [Nitrospinota bacterium]
MKIILHSTFIFLLSLFFLSACKGLPEDPTPANTVPEADAGTDISTSQNSTAVILNGSGSTDADGDSLTYSWSVLSTIGVTSATLTNPTSVSPTLNMTGFDASGDSVSVQLIVNDGTNNSLPSVLIISHT